MLVDAAVEEVVRRRVPLHTHGKAGPVVPLSICSNDERMTLRRERSTDFLREARFGRSRVSRRIGTKDRWKSGGDGSDAYLQED